MLLSLCFNKAPYAIRLMTFVVNYYSRKWIIRKLPERIHSSRACCWPVVSIIHTAWTSFFVSSAASLTDSVLLRIMIAARHDMTNTAWWRRSKGTRSTTSEFLLVICVMMTKSGITEQPNIPHRQLTGSRISSPMQQKTPKTGMWLLMVQLPWLRPYVSVSPTRSS